MTYDAVLVGIVEPVDADDDYWFQVGGLFYERLDATRNQAGLWMISLFLPEETLVDRIGAETPALLGNVTDTLYIDPVGLHGMGLARAESALAAARWPPFVRCVPELVHLAIGEQPARFPR